MTATSAILYRVVDFLKRYPPFQPMADGDLLALAGRGRVRFHESDEYLYWQGQPAGSFFLVIQQGAVSLLEDSGGKEQLRDVRGPGDLLAIDSLLGSATYLHSARAASDVLLYALEISDLQPLLEAYPAAARFVAAHASVGVTDLGSDSKKGAHQVFAYEAVRHRPLPSCAAGASVRDAALRLAAARAPALAVVDSEGRFAGVVTSASLLGWLGRDGADGGTPVSVLARAVPTVSPEATVGRCLIAAAEAGSEVVAITQGGTAGGALLALVQPADLGPVFGEEPLGLLGEIERAGSHEALEGLNQRARAFLLEQAGAPAAVDWMARYALLLDTAIVGRALDIAGLPRAGQGHTWFLFGCCGRGESLTALRPQIGVVFEDAAPDAPLRHLRHAIEALDRSGYLPHAPLSAADARFRCASVDEWEQRFRDWVRDPVGAQLYRARPMFDLTPLFGASPLLARLESVVRAETEASETFLRVLAHDCLGKLPPLSFFRDLVVEESGVQESTLHIERSALRPLVDVGRVFGLASGRIFGASTLDRLAAARGRFADHEAVFREAADTMRVLLYQQARSGLRRKDAGTEIPPSALSHHDRRVLKTGFRSILRLLEFTDECRWLAAAGP